MKQVIYVVDILHKPLLGQPAIKALRLLVRIRSISEDKLSDSVQRYHKLFNGLGRMQGKYTIQLKDGALPFALFTPCIVAILLMDSVKTELEKMKKLVVISQRETPTDWYAGMVVVPKSNNRVPICITWTKNFHPEWHPLPVIEETLA